MVMRPLLSLCLVFTCLIHFGQTPITIPGKTSDPNRVLLPNGWSLTPQGRSINLGDLPLNLIISPDGKMGAVTNNGQSTQTIQLIDLQKQRILDTRTIGKSWLGLSFGEISGDLFASGGNDNWVLRYKTEGSKLTPVDTFRLGKPWPEKISVAGIVADEKSDRLYATTREDNALYVLSLSSKKIISKIDLGAEAFTCLLSPDRKKIYVSCWGCDELIVLNTASLVIEQRIKVGDNPNDMVLSKDGKLIYVANANDNSVSVVDLIGGRETAVLNSALYPNSPSGSTTNSVALSGNGRSLFIANADNNCVAVYDVTDPNRAKSRGFIPVGWYPTVVRSFGKKLLVVNAKGFTSLPNPDGPNPSKRTQKVAHHAGDNTLKKEVQYIAGLFKGTLSFIQIPDEKKLNGWSQLVYANTPFNPNENSEKKWATSNPIPSPDRKGSPIKYVFYVLKENRTYDQVLGDLPKGNGDTSLVLFGRKVTPNQHALAEQFVLVDNFYVNGEVSADGHNWSMGAYATDYLEKTWPTSYGSRGGGYGGEGQRRIANNKNGFIWDFCKRAGVSYRTYGEFADDKKANIESLEGHFCKSYTPWDESVLDTVRFHQWRKDFDSLLRIGAVPQLNTVRFINDHTEGLRLGRPTPEAHVADNDYATGLFVEYLSKSPIWKESVVFITEDDAQNGPDHVDAHRSTLYIAGGQVKRNFVDHTMYSTASILRTIELILGLPPMSQYDAAAEPLWRCFTDEVNLGTFKSIEPMINLGAVNTALNEWQKKSEQFNFLKEDSAPDDDFNRVLWFAIKGDRPYPAPRYSAFFKAGKDEDEEEDD